MPVPVNQAQYMAMLAQAGNEVPDRHAVAAGMVRPAPTPNVKEPSSASNHEHEQDQQYLTDAHEDQEDTTTSP